MMIIILRPKDLQWDEIMVPLFYATLKILKVQVHN